MPRSILSMLAIAVAGSAAPASQRIELRDGHAEFEWMSTTTFRLLRSWHINRAPVTTASLILESADLKVELDPDTLHARVSADGKPLADLDGPTRAPGKLILERKLAPRERIHGAMGATASSPFVLSSRGFGQVVRGALKYLVDVSGAPAERLRITAQGADRIEYFFLYGPTPKEVFEQRKHALPIPDKIPERTIDLTKVTCESVQKMNAESMAGIFYEEDAGPEWSAFIGAYIREIHDRGLPTIRPLLLQFTRDPNASKNTSVMMFGDELLVAPKCASPLTLPQGLWTNLKTDVEHKSRSTVTLTDEVTMFARNGTIVPLKRDDIVELHYFPKLGAEFFILENPVSEYTQVHASQAADFWRLEIESKVTRTYEWVLHHIGEKPKRIRVEVKAGAVHILNIPI